jgi:hypothetical protein
MKLFEVKQEDGIVDPSNNKLETSKKTDTRRPRLTLEHLGKLRKMREIRKLEMESRKDLFKKIYARPTAME